MDPILGISCPKEDVSRYIHVGHLYMQESVMDRPTMSEIVFMLSHETIQLRAPKQPAFNLLRGEGQTDLSNDKAENCTRNELTISAMEGQ
ncbi:hypothetical protein GIB67_028402 [Kingdonia uniflora]|uniref:S-locus receptor kinase C-terminal domain-containing protein n=1 Tax=Kingdonia uniflora TaxID=39325 RepID=A0A7J7MI96_9MAGN|nr:hypothetical protein GIB67_028402 [Kingdonia uniflora]